MFTVFLKVYFMHVSLTYGYLCSLRIRIKIGFYALVFLFSVFLNICFILIICT